MSIWSFLASLLRPAAAGQPAATPSATPLPADGAATPPLVGRVRMGLVGMGVLPRLVDVWAVPIADACAEFGIMSQKNLACFLANVLQETGNLTVLRENLNYSPEGLARTWPTRFVHDGGPSAKAYALGRIGNKPANQRGIAEAAYGGRGGNRAEGSGDGFLYIGRGLIQITFYDNYRAVADAFGMRVEDVPAWLETPEGAARASAQYWKRAGLNRYGDAGDIRACRALANAGTLAIADRRILGLTEVTEKYEKLLPLLA